MVTDKLFILSNGCKIFIKIITLELFTKNSLYYFNWRKQVDKYLKNSYKEIDYNHFKEKFVKALKKNHKDIFLGAFHDEKLIGVVVLNNEIKNNKMKHIGRWGINIHPEFQNKGLGEYLLKLLEHLSLENGLRKLKASYVDGNYAAECLYLKKLNYKIEGRKKHSRLIDDTYRDVIFIGKFLINN